MAYELYFNKAFAKNEIMTMKALSGAWPPVNIQYKSVTMEMRVISETMTVSFIWCNTQVLLLDDANNSVIIFTFAVNGQGVPQVYPSPKAQPRRGPKGLSQARHTFTFPLPTSKVPAALIGLQRGSGSYCRALINP